MEDAVNLTDQQKDLLRLLVYNQESNGNAEFYPRLDRSAGRRIPGSGRNGEKRSGRRNVGTWRRRQGFLQAYFPAFPFRIAGMLAGSSESRCHSILSFA